VIINSVPAGASVLLDGVETGRTTPCVLEDIAPGTHTLSLRLEGYHTVEQQFALRAGDRSHWAPTLQPAAPQNQLVDVSFASNPVGAFVWLDDQDTGQKTPCTVPVSSGLHSISLRLWGYSNWDRRFNTQTITQVSADLSPSWGHRWSTNSWTQTGNYLGPTPATPLPATSLPGVPDDRYITLVDKVSYLCFTENHYCFWIAPGPGELDYTTQTADAGNPDCRIEFRLSTWEIPPYVGVERRYLSLSGKTSYSVASTDVPEGNDAVCILEWLGYWAGGDADLSCMVQAIATGRSIVVTAISDFGDQDSSEAYYRATVVYWPTGAPVECMAPKKLLAGGTGLGEEPVNFTGTMEMSTSLPDWPMWLATPTAYITDSSKYSNFDDFVTGLYNDSRAGKNYPEQFNVLGMIEDAGQLWAAIDSGQATEIAGSIYTDVWPYFRVWLSADDRDDDFWLSTTSDGPGQVKVAIGDGNQYSAGQVTAWAFQFP